MLCCVAFGLVVASILRAFRRVTGRGPEVTTVFAPPARRPAPGAPAAPPPAPVTPPRAPAPARARTGRAGPILRATAAGGAVYLVAVAALLAAGAASTSAGGATWTLRSLAYLVAAAGALIAAAAAPSPAAPVAKRETLGCALVGAGAAWLELGLLDMHLFGLLRIGGGLGGDVALPRRRRRRHRRRGRPARRPGAPARGTAGE